MADPDYFVKNMAFTKNAYRDLYPAIDPTRPELSQAGKVIVITGASRGLGQGFAIAFARANAAAIAILGRSAEGLAETERRISEVNQQTKVLSLVVDVTDEAGVNSAFQEIKSQLGTPHVLINNAGVFVLENLAESKMDTFWGTIEINLKGAILTTKAFLSTTGPSPAANTSIFNLTSVSTQGVPPEMHSYTISKLGLIKFTEFLNLEHPTITSISLDPGGVATDSARRVPLIAPFLFDSVELAAGAAVWLASGDRKFLSGRYVSVHWDVEELEERKGEIVEGDLLTVRLKRGVAVAAEEVVIHR
ncbi:hypothetical protein BJX70DRAFT_47862 [Aspergillus crustosus]